MFKKKLFFCFTLFYLLNNTLHAETDVDTADSDLKSVKTFYQSLENIGASNKKILELISDESIKCCVSEDKKKKCNDIFTKNHFSVYSMGLSESAYRCEFTPCTKGIWFSPTEAVKTKYYGKDAIKVKFFSGGFSIGLRNHLSEGFIYSEKGAYYLANKAESAPRKITSIGEQDLKYIFADSLPEIAEKYKKIKLHDEYDPKCALQIHGYHEAALTSNEHIKKQEQSVRNGVR